VKSNWLKGYKASEREARKKEVLGFRNAFDELRVVLERDYKKKEAVRDYGSPNWTALQISHNEYNQVLSDILKLIDLTESEEE
jgi:hypothetical protein